MNKKEFINIIQDLSNLPGAPGFEKQVSEKVIDILNDYDIGNGKRDKMNNVYVRRNGNETESEPIKVLLDAHLDEVGFMVKNILKNGTMSFIPLGGWISSNIPAHNVFISTNKNGLIKGTVASKPPHFMSAEEKKKGPEIDEMVIDIGSGTYEETYNLGIRPGAPVTPDTAFSYNEERDLLMGKAFDCRIGCASIIKTLVDLKETEIKSEIIAAFSTQEEVGTRGAAVTSQVVKPDIAIVFEGCPADDTFESPETAQTIMKKGPMLRHIDARMITNSYFQNFALKLAEELGIPVQTAVRTGGSTNGSPIHLAEKAVPTIVIGIPVRYIHTHNCFASLEDVNNSVRLAVEIIKRINRNWFDNL